MGTNALASPVVLACVPRAEHASLATRREFITALKKELGEAPAYNSLVITWPEIRKLAQQTRAKAAEQNELFR